LCPVPRAASVGQWQGLGIAAFTSAGGEALQAVTIAIDAGDPNAGC
jgi:hypothetical protein